MWNGKDMTVTMAYFMYSECAEGIQEVRVSNYYETILK